MKRITLLLFLVPALLFSCSLFEDANTIDLYPTLSVDIPVAVSNMGAMLEKSTQADFQFSQSATASLAEVSEVSDYLNKIKSIDINNLKIIFTNLGPNEEIKSIDISVTGVGILATITNVSSANHTHTPTVDSAKLMQAANILNSTKAITVTVSGATNAAPMNFTVNMHFDCHIEAEAL